MGIVAAVHFGIALPVVPGGRAALVALTAVVGVKVALALLSAWLRARA